MTEASWRQDCFAAAVSLALRQGRIPSAEAADEALCRATDLTYILIDRDGAVIGRYLLDDLQAEWSRQEGLGSGVTPTARQRRSLTPFGQVARPRRFERQRGYLVAGLAIGGSVLLLISLGSCFENNLDGFITFAMLGLGCLFLSALVALSFAFF
ncbi:hypothetical protein [Cyanobium sp. Morenito 9A2]|uniref:hypothetical protein n=1 Tax=Cyanobium sp. Morenito 9A2 TaxID=2823718 RepID=UPI0020CD6070|nr:hypothetical protein [Cyanobium sp. Morenito 9A2]MCP9849036.1 hypothetical protein [Cyanobium sp. Morenito 9A2]